MNKKQLTEADIRTKFMTPAIVGPNGSKWDVMTQIMEERYFTNGRVIVRGKTVTRGEAKKADSILFDKPNLPIAVVEAKDNNHSAGAGMQQALEYAEILDVPFAIKAGNFNLDLKNPHNAGPGPGPGDVDHLLPEYEKLLAQIAATRGQLKAQLMEALTR